MTKVKNTNKNGVRDANSLRATGIGPDESDDIFITRTGMRFVTPTALDEFPVSVVDGGFHRTTRIDTLRDVHDDLGISLDVVVGNFAFKHLRAQSD